jgi:DNA replication protein DnaC
MTTAIEHLQSTLNGLGLKAVEARLENLLEQAAKTEPSYADFLRDLLGCEVDARRSRYLRARLQLAHLPFLKNFDQFDFGFQPSIDERQIRELRTLRFIHDASNVIFLGPPGVGKTHLSVALAEAAIQSGFGAYFMTAHDLVSDLGRAYREGRLDRRMRGDTCRWMRWAPRYSSSSSVLDMNEAASFCHRTRVTGTGVRSSEIPLLPPLSWIGCSTIRQRSTSVARVIA